ncbi:MAG: iron-sulfur cluster assembly scaffold protein [Nanoarchaeota archaeon]
MLNKTLFREELLEIYSERPNYGKLKNKTHEITIKNPICDDIINLELEVKDEKILNVGFTGGGCFVSTVSTSVLLEKIKGMNIQDILKLGKKDLDDFIGAEITLTRVKCQILPLEGLKKILREK